MVKIKWRSDFSAKRSKYFYEAMIKKKKYDDVSFKVGDHSFFAHMIVLSACSEFFIENKDLSATFSKFEFPVIDEMLKFCCLGEIDLEEKYHKKFLELAKEIEITDKIATQYNTIDETNCLKVLTFSDNPMSIDTALDITIENFKTLYKNPDFLGLPASYLVKVLKSNDINVDSEEQVFDSVKLWVERDVKERKSELAELLGSVQFSLLSMKFLVTEAMSVCSLSPKGIEMFKHRMRSICQSSIKKQSLPRKSDKIVLIGGNNEKDANTIEIYDGNQKNWLKDENTHTFNRTNFTSLLVGNWIMIMGGVKEENNIPVASVMVNYIDLENGQMKSLEPLNHGRLDFSAVTLPNGSSHDVYAIGGLSTLEYLSSVERWNSETKKWVSITQLIQAVYWHSAAVIGTDIYVTGGKEKKIKKKNTFKTINAVQKYSVKSNSWTNCTPMNENRENHSSITIKGKLYVAGGRNNTQKFLASVESYDPDKNLWTPYCNLPNPAYGFSLCFYRNNLLFIGGLDETSYPMNNAWQYDEMNKVWNVFPRTHKSRRQTVAIFIPHDSIVYPKKDVPSN
ncbi:kelch-like protein 25 [Arctopsyche grandis]|uniref:kelch-like protein 25 n=1 Tax=Arctopsyche grandis TaxID=121162 RepID=UPI00406D6F14